jgi:hypothetical protein
MKLIGQKRSGRTSKANAVQRAWAVQGALAGLLGFVRQIPTPVTAFKALEIVDLIVVPRAFGKLAAVRRLACFVKWAGTRCGTCSRSSSRS